MNREILINDFAIRSFRDIADCDYIAARMAYRAQLIPQFLWSSLQAIEKYLKCILLLNRIKAKNLRHDLGAALSLIDKQAPFKLRLSESSHKLIDHLDTYGRFRYLETPFHVMGLELPRLDLAVWEIRRYCNVLNYELSWGKGEPIPMFEIELKKIKNSENRPPQRFSLIGGTIEKIIGNAKHPARKALIWQNFYFGVKPRKKVRLRQLMHATNSPLSLHPEILDDVLKYVFLPKDVIAAYRAELTQRSKGRDTSDAPSI